MHYLDSYMYPLFLHTFKLSSKTNVLYALESAHAYKNHTQGVRAATAIRLRSKFENVF